LSQQINLINPALRPRRDWLSLGLVVGVTVAILLVEIAVYAKVRNDQTGLVRQTQGMTDDAKRLQDELLTLSKLVAERHPDPALALQIESLTADVQASQAMLETLRSMQPGNGFSPLLLGFSRQTMEGLWLTEFDLKDDALSIRGRMVDVALLPTYIRRLNGEPTFQGREFSALDMKSVEPAKSDPRSTTPALPPFTEFTLRGVLPAAGGDKP